MVAYVIAQMSIHDPETYRKYASLAHSAVKRYGGKYLTRGEPVSVIEGQPFEQRMVILEFPNEDAAHMMFSDPEYLKAAKFRHEASVGIVILQNGSESSMNPNPNV